MDAARSGEGNKIPDQCVASMCDNVKLTEYWGRAPASVWRLRESLGNSVTQTSIVVVKQLERVREIST